MPVGFAGGLTDPDTGFVRFGWRDYDPAVGRFTAPDPARDRRGDGDLYEYCMDDPVSRVDPTGLWSKENFDESKVSRDGDGRFASGGGSVGTEPELTFAQALAVGVCNTGSSGKSFVNDLYEAVMNPVQTIEGICSIIAGYGCQFLEIESDYRAYSDAVTEYFSARYGSYAGFKKTLAQDPVGLAADLSMFVTAGGGALRSAAKAGTVASRVLPAGGVLARGVEGAMGALGKVGANMGTVGAAADPLCLPGKAVGKAVHLLPKSVQQKFSAIHQDKISQGSTILSRSKTIIGIGGTQYSIDKIRKERDKKE